MKKNIKSLRNIKAKSLIILKKNGVKKAGIFGSYARGDQKKSSDIDFIIQFSKGKNFFDLVGLKLELEEKLNTKVDIITYKSIHPLLKDNILREEVKIL